MTLCSVSEKALNLKLGLVLLLCSACQSEQYQRPSLNLDLATCLSPESNACQDQLFALQSSQNTINCLLLMVDNELKANILVSWDNDARLTLSKTPQISLDSTQKLKASLIFAYGEGPISCVDFTENFNQQCESIPSCMLKLSSRESQLEGSAVTIDFTDGLGLCNPDISQDKLSEIQEGDLKLFEEIYNDGKDNDCDSLVDEFISEPCTLEIDRCRSEGRSAINEEGEYCDAPMIAVSPSELCGDGIDNDCNGNIDEGFNEEGEPCTPESGIEASGRWVCLGSNPTELSCRDRSSALATDICNGFDDNANGQIDEDAMITEVECMNTMCATQGIRRCENGVFVTTCLAQAVEYQGQLVTEESINPVFLCDGIDNDCDGEVDEDFTSTAMSCGQGACSNNQGVSRCVNGALQVECEPLPGTSELCDERDNDCDGQIDEEVTPSLLANDQLNCGACGHICPTRENTEALCQNGVCRLGECQAGFGDGPEPGPCDCPLIPNMDFAQCCQITESQCDGYDDDCDGNIDEGVLNRCGSCDNLVESCDPIDNDCDGEIDEGNVCGNAIATECTAWLTHQRQITGSASYIVSNTVAYQDRNTHFVPLRQRNDDESDIFPITYSVGQGADRLIPQLACNDLIESWKTWIESNCRITVIWGDRGMIDPWTCQDPMFNNEISPRCNVSGMTSDPVSPIRDPINQINLGLSCQDPSDGQDPQGVIARDRVLTELSFKIALIQLPANADEYCETLEENTSIPIDSCSDLFRGDNVICGLAESRIAEGNRLTSWSSINIPTLNDDDRRCYQFLFARSLTSSSMP